MAKTTKMRGLLEERGISVSSFLNPESFKRYNIGFALPDLLFAFLSSEGKSNVQPEHVRGLDDKILADKLEMDRVIGIIRENPDKFPDLAKEKSDEALLEKYIGQRGLLASLEKPKFENWKLSKTMQGTIRGEFGYYQNLIDSLVYFGLVKEGDENWEYLQTLPELAKKFADEKKKKEPAKEE